MIRAAGFELESAPGTHGATTTAELFPGVYQRLCDLAAVYLRGQVSARTTAPEGVVHEAFIRLVDGREWKNSAHLLGVAARTMKEVIVDRERQRLTAKRGGPWRRVCLNGHGSEARHPADELAFKELLESLRHENVRQAEVTQLRFLAGMTSQEVAETLSISVSTVEADWRSARGWLQTRLAGCSGRTMHRPRLFPSCTTS